ncbi:MAG: MATE family efflux transporter, partial [Lachnospiraceae bacterium]|nr:MATE family efflux transporter [Lachnospiraceae bacterium]
MPKAILSLAVPTVISQLVFVIYNIADTFFIGQLGDPNQVAAATIALPFFIFGAAFSNLFGIGGSGVIARNLGTGNVERAKKCAS